MRRIPTHQPQPSWCGCTGPGPEHPAFLDPLPRSPLVSTPGWTPGPRPPRADTARYQGIKRMARLLPRAPTPALPIPLPAPPKLPAESRPQVGPSLPKASPEAPSHTEPAYSRIPATPAQPPGWEWGPRGRSPDDGATGQGSPVACESGAGPSTRSHLLPEPPLCPTLDLADEDAENGGWTPTSPASPLEWVKPARAQRRGCHPGPARPHMAAALTARPGGSDWAMQPHVWVQGLHGAGPLPGGRREGL